MSHIEEFVYIGYFFQCVNIANSQECPCQLHLVKETEEMIHT